MLPSYPASCDLVHICSHGDQGICDWQWLSAQLLQLLIAGTMGVLWESQWQIHLEPRHIGVC